LPAKPAKPAKPISPSQPQSKPSSLFLVVASVPWLWVVPVVVLEELSVVEPGALFVWAVAGRIARLKARALAPTALDKVEIFMVKVLVVSDSLTNLND
jgi:hypothetical protein